MITYYYKNYPCIFPCILHKNYMKIHENYIKKKIFKIKIFNNINICINTIVLNVTIRQI